MSRYFPGDDYVGKIHLYRDQHGATIGRSGRMFANTLCKMNSNVPAERITTDPSAVTCKLCLRDHGFPSKPTVAPPPPVFRHRQNWRGKLVLQIAETVPTNYDPKDPRDIAPRAWTTKWRDARVEDLPPGVFPVRQ